MTKDTNRTEPDVAPRGAEKPRVERMEAVPPTLVDPFLAFAQPAPPEEPEPTARAVVDELPRRDVEELNRALDEATGVASSVVVTVKLSPREYRRLSEHVKATGETEQMIMREALFEYLDRRRP